MKFAATQSHLQASLQSLVLLAFPPRLQLPPPLKSWTLKSHEGWNQLFQILIRAIFLPLSIDLRWHPDKESILQEMQEMWVWSLGREDPLEKGMASHSSILAWRIPWTEELGGLQSERLQRVRQDSVTEHACLEGCLARRMCFTNEPFLYRYHQGFPEVI